jgi:hypothetical protein
MGRTLEEMIASEAPAIQAKIEARFTELEDEAAGLAEIRKLAAHSQVELAHKLHVKQPSISRMERQADMYLSTLREYIEAAGGKLRLVVTLPNHSPVVLTGLGDIGERRAMPTPGMIAKKVGKAKPRTRPAPAKA